MSKRIWAVLLIVSILLCGCVERAPDVQETTDPAQQIQETTEDTKGEETTEDTNESILPEEVIGGGEDIPFGSEDASEEEFEDPTDPPATTQKPAGTTEPPATTVPTTTQGQPEPDWTVSNEPIELPDDVWD